jgi:integrase/recombinase XerC
VGNSFEASRDTALLMLPPDAGARREEMAGLTVHDVDLDLDVLVILGKGRRERSLRSGTRPGRRSTGYLRTRARHKYAELLVAVAGPAGSAHRLGLVTMLRRRGRQAGLPKLHPHQHRHTLARQWLARKE